MARSRFENLDRDKQEAILQVAAEEFAERGYEGASINRIIERSGMSKGSVYYYFEDKADLFATTLERSIQRIMDEIGWFSLEVLGPEMDVAARAPLVEGLRPADEVVQVVDPDLRVPAHDPGG